ncbi:MAG: transcription factor S [Nanoarchaeota archaeon]
MFCPKCGSILIPKKVDSKKILACSCGFNSKDIKTATITEDVRKPDMKIEVVKKGEEPLPKIDAECPTCKHDKAYYWTIQTRSADEAETKFLKCEKCGHTWRDYD